MNLKSIVLKNLQCYLNVRHFHFSICKIQGLGQGGHRPHEDMLNDKHLDNAIYIITITSKLNACSVYEAISAGKQKS